MSLLLKVVLVETPSSCRKNHNGQSATVPVHGPWPGGGTMLGGRASLPSGDGAWAEVMVECHPVIATAASAAASTGSRSLRGLFIGLSRPCIRIVAGI